MLEDDYEAAVAESHRIPFVCDPSVVEEFRPVGGCEMFALIGEHVIRLVQFVRQHWRQCGLSRYARSCRFRRSHQDKVCLSHASEEGSERGRRVVPSIADLSSGAAEIVQENYDILLPKLLGVTIG